MAFPFVMSTAAPAQGRARLPEVTPTAVAVGSSPARQTYEGPASSGRRALVRAGPGQTEYSPEKDSKTHRMMAGTAKKTPMMNSHQPTARPANMVADASASQSGVHDLATK